MISSAIILIILTNKKLGISQSMNGKSHSKVNFEGRHKVLTKWDEHPSVARSLGLL